MVDRLVMLISLSQFGDTRNNILSASRPAAAAGAARGYVPGGGDNSAGETCHFC